jgi:hypothetical protein
MNMLHSSGGCEISCFYREDKLTNHWGKSPEIGKLGVPSSHAWNSPLEARETGPGADLDIDSNRRGK